MLLVLPDFDVLFTDTMEEACSLLQRYSGDARVLAGGTDLLVKMKHRHANARRLVNIKRIPGLDRISSLPDRMCLGALTTAESIKESAATARQFPILCQAAGRLGTPQIRNLATIGGNLANASPSAEFAPVLLSLDASVKCVGERGERMVAMADFFVAPGRTVLADDEILSEIHVPVPPAGFAGIYLKHSFRRMDVAIASAAVSVRCEDGICREARIALGAVAPTPFRARRAEAALCGQTLSGGDGDTMLFAEVGRIAAGETAPIDDLRGYADYRRKTVKVLVEQGLEAVAALSAA